jgi:hypothetical protein
MHKGSTHGHPKIEKVINLPNHTFPQYPQLKAFPDFDVRLIFAQDICPIYHDQYLLRSYP